MALIELCPDCHGDEWILVDDDRLCVLELTEVFFDCPCGCNADANLCVYAETCPDCGARYYAGHGHKNCPAAR